MTKVLQNKHVQPFLKWAGGKRQLLSEIKKYIPENINTYYEPFIGGGAVFFDLQHNRAVINDINKELINVYRVIKDKVDELIEELKKHEHGNNREYFYKIRDLDRNKEKYEQMSSVEKAARMIYLNKTCYNGLFRVNSNGQFNVPFGRYKNPQIVNEEVLRAVHNYLRSNDITILNVDFSEAVLNAKKRRFCIF